VMQALVESILLAVAGGVAGLLVAVGTARLLLALAFAGATFLPIDTRPAPVVLAFAFGLALVTGVVFGAVPAYRTGWALPRGRRLIDSFINTISQNGSMSGSILTN